MLCSPPAKGLFHKAIVQSGGLSLMTPDEYAAAGVYDDYKAALNLKGEWSLEALEALSAADVYAASTRYKNRLMKQEGVAKSPPNWHALADGDVVAADPLAYVRSGGEADVSVVVGQCHHEAHMLVGFMGSALAGSVVFPMLLPMGVRAQLGFRKSHERDMPAGALKALCADVRANMGAAVAAGAGATGRTFFGATADDGLGAAVSWVFGCGGVACVALCEALASAPDHAPLRAYELRLSAAESPKSGSGHCVDLPLLFKPADAAEAAFVAAAFQIADSPAIGSVARDVRRAWAAFAADETGGRGTVRYADEEWPLFPKCMTIASKPPGDNFAPFSKESERCKAWTAALEKNGFAPLPKKDPAQSEGGGCVVS